MLKIYLTNLGKYNEGELIGEWVNLPVSDDGLEAVKKRIGISDEPDENGNYYEEWFITDYETDMYGLKVGEYDDLDELNELADELENLDSDQLQAIKAFLEDGSTFNEALEGIQDGNYRIYTGCATMTDVAMEVVEECGMLRMYLKMWLDTLIMKHLGVIWILKENIIALMVIWWKFTEY